MTAPERLDRPSILIVGDTLNAGGTEGQLVEIACGLDRSRWDVGVACVSAEGPLRARLERAGVSPSSCGPRSFKSPRLVTAIGRLARRLRRDRVSLVHAFDFYSNVLGVLAGRLAGVSAILASQRDLGNLRSPGYQRLHRMMLRLADRVVVNSQAVADRVTASGLSTERIILLRNGIDLSRFMPRDADRGARLFTVGTITNLRAEKGVEDFVRAAAIVHAHRPAARFLIWGDGPRRAAVEELIRAHGLESVMRLGGRTAAPEAALRELDVFVLPSLSEASSNALLEAMASRVAVIATSVGGNVEMLDDGRAGMLVPPAFPKGIAEAILTLAARPAWAAELADRARRRVEDLFDRQRMLADLDGLYATALQRDSAGIALKALRFSS